jgi:hypothetical protein
VEQGYAIVDFSSGGKIETGYLSLRGQESAESEVSDAREDHIKAGDFVRVGRVGTCSAMGKILQ